MATQAVRPPAAMPEDVTLTPYEPGLGLPLFIQPRTSKLVEDIGYFQSWFRDNEAAIDELLYDVGALVFRGFPVRTTADFGTLVEHYGTPPLGYTGGSTPRGQLGPKVFEATKTPANMLIALHQEMAYLPTYPDRIAFFCRMPSVMGGETILGDMRRLTKELDPAFVAEVDRRGILYTRNLRDRNISTGNEKLDAIHRTWQDAFSTEDPQKPLEDAAKMGLGAQWLEDGSLRVTYQAPGLRVHPKTGERLWFNQLQTLNLGPHNTPDYALYEARYGASGDFPFAATYGDGEKVEPENVLALNETAGRCSVAFPWSSGDVLLIDNYRAAHGRNPFRGERDVQVALLN